MNINATEWSPLTEDMYADLEGSYWLADRNGHVYIGQYVWKQGRNPDRFIVGTSVFSTEDFPHIMRMVVPKPPQQGE